MEPTNKPETSEPGSLQQEEAINAPVEDHGQGALNAPLQQDQQANNAPALDQEVINALEQIERDFNIENELDIFERRIQAAPPLGFGNEHHDIQIAVPGPFILWHRNRNRRNVQAVVVGVDDFDPNWEEFEFDDLNGDLDDLDDD